MYCELSPSLLQQRKQVNPHMYFSSPFSRSSSTWPCKLSTRRCRCPSATWPPTVSLRTTRAGCMLAWCQPWTRRWATSLWLCSREVSGTTQSSCSQPVCIHKERAVASYTVRYCVYKARRTFWPWGGTRADVTTDYFPSFNADFIHHFTNSQVFPQETAVCKNKMSVNRLILLSNSAKFYFLSRLVRSCTIFS